MTSILRCCSRGHPPGSWPGRHLPRVSGGHPPGVGPGRHPPRVARAVVGGRGAARRLAVERGLRGAGQVERSPGEDPTASPGSVLPWWRARGKETRGPAWWRVGGGRPASWRCGLKKKDERQEGDPPLSLVETEPPASRGAFSDGSEEALVGQT